MAALKSILAVVAVLVISVLVQSQVGEAQQSCPAQLTSLNVCGQYVVPGATADPSPQCCTALQTVEHDCLCNTLRIAARLPSRCSMPPLNCGN
ncbi:stamen-specific protein FIL1-like [Mercurialis annua]|uniref:stamen-specific protein FIL1-like n=1 Tax=Mercurialis annua TaxID=3986 RepID=UPI0021600422|nr:stamen-specific protein FIL1-like [Mercurialis annua]